MVKLYEKNPKKHPDIQLKQIASSLKEFGWRQPIVIDKNETIIVGHGRWLAYQKYPGGSTLIACEKINRICYGMEIDEHYCDIILKRWEDYTNGKARKIN